MSEAITVACAAEGEDWRCSVFVSDGRGETSYLVMVSRADLQRYDPGATDPDDLVRRSFEFLLAHEPKESILRSFDLPVIERYFPDYREAIRAGG